MGSPQQPSAEQYARLEAAGGLELLESPRWVSTASNRLELDFIMPRHAVSLVQISF
jgi:xylan 1,4-beta-xylosidase